MATISSLWKAIDGKRQKSTTGGYFITTADQKAIFTRAAIESLVHENGITMLAIVIPFLVWMKEVKSIVNFRKYSELDSRLPLDEKRAIRIAPTFGSSLAREVQWQFIPYFFKKEMCETHILIDEANILPFVKEENLGEGAFGAVYKMTLPSSQHEFQLDSPKARGQSSIVRKRIKLSTSKAIEQELKCLLLLHGSRHPNIVPFLGSYELNNEHNFLFPCLDMDLNEMLKREDRFGNFQWDFTFFAALSGLASAMHNLHELELTPEANDVKLAAKGYHHDFRPANILVSQETFLLTDFGLAKLKPDNQTSQTVWSTTIGDYIAPECMNADFEPQKVGRGIDIWALGCLLFEVGTYMERGPKGLQQFRDKREGPGLMMGWTDQKFCDRDGVRPAVLEWRQELIDRPKTPFLADLLEVALDALQIEPLDRPKARAISERILFPSVKVHFGAVQSAFSEYVDLAIEQGDKNTPPMQILCEKERIHAFGTVLGLEGGRNLIRPKPEDMESMCEHFKTLFRIFMSEISQPSKRTQYDSPEQSISVYVRLLWSQVSPKFREDMVREVVAREKVCLKSLLGSIDSHGSMIVSQKSETFAWIHHNPKYEAWLETNSSSLLWVLEAEGRVKTVLASFLVDELTRQSQRKNGASIVTQVSCGIRSVDKKDATWILRYYQLIFPFFSIAFS